MRLVKIVLSHKLPLLLRLSVVPIFESLEEDSGNSMATSNNKSRAVCFLKSDKVNGVVHFSQEGDGPVTVSGEIRSGLAKSKEHQLQVHSQVVTLVHTSLYLVYVHQFECNPDEEENPDNEDDVDGSVNSKFLSEDGGDDDAGNDEEDDYEDGDSEESR